MKFTYFLVLLPFLFSACGDSGSSHDHSQHSATSPRESQTQLPNPVSVVNGVTVVEMTGNDRMKFNLEAFSVPSGGQIQLKFTNRGKMPKSSMGHNVVFLLGDVDANAFVTAAAMARENDYIPEDLKGQILAATKLLGPGESDTIEFTAPTEPGEYTFLCSFPAHLFAGMRGVMTVE